MSNPNTLPMKPSEHASKMGLILGGYMCLAYSCFMFVPTIPILAVFVLTMLLLTPLISYRLGKSYRGLFSQDQPYSFALAWAHGTQMFVCAAIILLIPGYLYYTKVLPEQLPYIELIMEDFYKQDPQAREILTKMYQGDPIEVIGQLTSRDRLWLNLWSMFSSVVFWGSIVSLVNALLLKRKKLV